MIYPRGSELVGSWQNGKPLNTSLIMYGANGVNMKYEGGFNDETKLHGQGQWTISYKGCECSFVSEWLNGKRTDSKAEL